MLVGSLQLKLSRPPKKYVGLDVSFASSCQAACLQVIFLQAEKRHVATFQANVSAKAQNVPRADHFVALQPIVSCS